MAPGKRTNTPTEQNKEDNSLILYRLDKVEAAVQEVSSKIDKQENIKKSDLKDFQDTIVTRFLDMRADLQKQIDDNAKSTDKSLESKASNSDLQDFKKVSYSLIGFASSILLAFMGFLLSKV